MSDSPTRIVALEVWRLSGRFYWSVVLTRHGDKFLYANGYAKDSADQLLQWAADGFGPPDLADLHAESYLLEAGARRAAIRGIQTTIGGERGADRIYGGPLKLNLAARDVFEDADPVDDNPPADEAREFDASNFRARRAARAEARKRQEAIDRANVDREARGKTTIRAYRRHDMRIACVPVVGVDAEGTAIATGTIITDYPGYAVIEAENVPELHKTPTFWFYRPSDAVSIPVGASTRMEAP